MLLLLVLLTSLAGMQPTPVSAATAATRLNNLEACSQVKIIPLGDSITYDYHDNETRPSSERVGYRLPLWELLVAGGYSVDFVGSRVAGEALGQDLVPPFDPDNEGHSGWTDDQIAAEIYNWLAATPADVVLMHIGTNALDTSPGDVETILNEINRWEADSGKQVTVLLARIINRSIYSADTTTFNDNVATLAQARIAVGDEIIVIDMENGAGLNYGVVSTPPYDDGDIYDYLHPHEAGYAKMASAWLNGDSSGSPRLADILPVCELQSDPEPLGHWAFDESSWAGDCSIADILDSSGNNHHGTACIDGDAPVPVPGKFGNAGQFDGVNQYANMGPDFNFTSSFTAAMWIALDDYDWCGPTSKSQHLIGTHHLATPTGNGRGWGIYWDCDGLAWELTDSTGSRIESYGFIQPSPFPVNGSWHHIALVYDSTVPSATLYWDGSPIYSESGIASVPGILFNNGEPLTINGLPYAPSSGAPGKIDDTRVFNSALSAAEIQRLFDNQPPVAVENAYSTSQEAILNVTAPGVLGNDSDPNGDAIMAVKVSDPANGTLSLNANGSFTYTPNAGFSGVDTFTYKASDGSLQSNVASVSIQVNAVPAPRVLSVLRANSSPSSESCVDFTVTFSEPVTGVDATDFTLSTVGVTGSTVTVVTGTGAMRTVTVNTGSGNGTIRLDVVDDDSIRDAANHPLGGTGVGNGNYSSGNPYTINKVPEKDTVGVFRPSNGLLYLKNFNTSGFADVALNYGLAGDYPVIGDWDGDGDDTIGVYRNGTFLLRNSNTVGFAELNFPFGQAGDQPIAGDWDGDGVDTIGVYRPSTGQFLLRYSNSAGVPDRSFFLGNVGDVGIAGDWNGDGIDTTGVFRPSSGVIFLKNFNQSGFADVALNYGLPGDKPVVGDWDDNGTTTIGVFRRGQFLLRNSNTNGFANIIFDLGNTGDMPIAGNWDGVP